MVVYRTVDKVVSATGSTLAPTAAQSGCYFILSRAAGIAVSLPTPASGLEYTFIVGVAPTGGTGYVITSTSNGTDAANITYGPTINGQGNAAGNGAAEDVCTLVNDSAVIGDRINYRCDGTNWYVEGYATLAASITIA